MARWPDCRVSVVAFIRFAMVASSAGAMALSLRATTYQVGTFFQATCVAFALNAFGAEMGPCVAAIVVCSAGDRSCAKSEAPPAAESLRKPAASGSKSEPMGVAGAVLLRDN